LQQRKDADDQACDSCHGGEGFERELH
jgi:hypothetical protein